MVGDHDEKEPGFMEKSKAVDHEKSGASLGLTVLKPLVESMQIRHKDSSRLNVEEGRLKALAVAVG